MTEAEVRLLRFARVTSGIGNSINVPIMMATGSITALGIATAAAAYESVKLAAVYEQMGIAIEVMVGSATKAQRILTEISQLAVESPFKTPGLVAAAKQLSSFGVGADELLPTLRALGDVASGVNIGNIDQTMARISLAFGQIKTAGRLMGPELRQLNEAGVPIIENLSKVMNKPVSSIKALVEEGKVGFPIVVEAFNRMTGAGGLFFQMMERQNKTVMGQWNAFVETLQLTGMRAGESFFRVFGIKDLLGRARGGLQGTQTEQFDEFFRRVKKGIDDVVLVVKAAWAIISGLARRIKDVWDATTGWMEANRALVANIAIVIGALAAATLLVKGFVAVYGIIIAIKGGAVGLMALPLLPWILGVAGAIALIVVSLREVGALDNMLETLKGFQHVGETIRETWKGMQDALKSGDTKLAGDIFFKGLELGFKQVIGILKGLWFDFIHGMAAAVVTFIGKIVMGAIDAAESVQMFFSPQDNAKIRDKWNVDRNQFLEKQKEVLAGIERERQADKAGVMDTPEIRRLRLELKELTGRAAAGAAPPIAGLERMTVPQFEEGVAEIKRNMIRWQSGELGGMFGGGFMGRLADVGYTQQFIESMRNRTDFPANDMRAGMRVPMRVSSEAQLLADKVIKDMANREINPLSQFNRNMGLLSEGFFGPARAFSASIGAVGGGLGMAGVGKALGPLSQEAYEMGMFNEYEKLRKSVQDRQDRPPPFALRGSQEAQETINRAQSQTMSVQEEIRNIMKQAEEQGRRRTEYMREVVEELRKINAETGGGGDF